MSTFQCKIFYDSEKYAEAVGEAHKNYFCLEITATDKGDFGGNLKTKLWVNVFWAQHFLLLSK